VVLAKEALVDTLVPLAVLEHQAHLVSLELEVKEDKEVNFLLPLIQLICATQLTCKSLKSFGLY
jgi:hypothetical protein